MPFHLIATVSDSVPTLSTASRLPGQCLWTIWLLPSLGCHYMTDFVHLPSVLPGQMACPLPVYGRLSVLDCLHLQEGINGLAYWIVSLKMPITST